jgi:branched-subunit amino acid aminotransferase/4-amino-4-deoxychorismate lyase
MQIGAERMCMPTPSVDQFVHAVKQTVLANKRWVSAVDCEKVNTSIISRNAFKYWTKLRRPELKLIVIVSFLFARYPLQEKVPSISDHC